MHVIDLVAKVVLITLTGCFMFSVVAGMAVIGCAVYRDFQSHDEYDVSFTIGTHGRRALAVLKPWFRRVVLLWASILLTAILWTVIHIFFASSSSAI